MKITTDHPAARFGVPVFLDDGGNPLGHAAGLKAVRARLGLSTGQVGEAVGKSGRTVEDWEQGRVKVPASALYVLAELLGQSAGSPVHDA